MSMTTEIEYVILESEYNVLMALMKSYEKEYVMEFYYMEAGFKDNIQKAGRAVTQGVSNVGQKIDQGFDNAIQKGNTAVDKVGQKISNATNNSNGNFTQNLSNKIENGINKLLGWCKKASNFVVLNTKKIPPETQVQAPPQTQQLQQEVQKYTQVNQRAIQALSQPDNQQNEQEFKQIAAELAEIEKKMKALQIKKTLLEKQQRELSQSQQPQNQQLPPLKFNRPQQQTQQPTPQPSPQPTPQNPTQPTPQNQPNTQQTSQPTQQDGFVTIKAGDFQAMIKQLQEQQQKIDQSVNQSLQQANQAANNAQTATSSVRQQLMNQSVKTQAVILNDCVEITKDMKRQVNGNTSDAKPITGEQLAQIVVRLMKTSDVPNQYNYNPQTQTFSLVQNQNQLGTFIWDSNTTLMYPVIMNIPSNIPDIYGVYQIGKNVRGIEDNTIVIPAQAIKQGFLSDNNTLTLFKSGALKSSAGQPQQNQNTNSGGMTASQMVNVVADMNSKGSAQGYQHRDYNVGTKRLEFNTNEDSKFIVDTRDMSVYPNIKSIPAKTLGFENVFDCKTNRIDDNTPITPAKIENQGYIIQKGVIG